MMVSAAFGCDLAAFTRQEQLAASAISTGRLSEARHTLRALAEGSSGCGESAFPYRIRSLLDLAGVERVLKNHKAGLEWAERARQAAESSGQAAWLADALLAHAQLLAAAGKYYDAELEVRRAMEIWQREGGSHGVEIASCLNTLAILHAGLADPDGARRHLRRALQFGRGSGADLVVAGSLHALAAIEWQAGNGRESLSLLDEAKAMAERTLGAEHPYLADLLASYSRVLASLHRKAEARRFSRRAKSLALLLSR